MRKIDKAKMLKRSIENKYNISLSGRKRLRHNVDLRRVYSIISVEHFGLTHQSAANIIKRDHSSVTHYIRTGMALLETDLDFQCLYNEIMTLAGTPEDLEFRIAFHKVEMRYHKREIQKLEKLKL